MLDSLEPIFRRIVPAADFCSLRYYGEREEQLAVRQDVPEPIRQADDAGVMLTVADGGGLGYAATSDLSEDGLGRAMGQAQLWARRSAGRSVIDFRKVAMPCPRGEYVGPCRIPWSKTTPAEKLDLLVGLSRRLKRGETVTDWSSGLFHSDIETLYLTAAGGRAYQRFHLTGPALSVTASRGNIAQTRTFGGQACCQQGGLEVLEAFGLQEAPERIADEALALLEAPNCPSGRMDLLLAADQMILQIHESIGHPLELDRILGDERNYAGTSFVTRDMLGRHQYGSSLLNITFDPTRPEQMATYRFDDDGLEAKKTYLIRAGILQGALGGVTSQARTGLAGVASGRANTWNRPPIDRMANLNLEPGDRTLEQMIASVKQGIYMQTNNSWSIDDSRNKFQFGCEWGRLIEDGRLTRLVRNPNYRGISAVFWRNLKGVGDASTFQVLGTPNCGKGEPNQIMYVAHATPACLFADVEVFGGT